jgi:TRAP-type C4-dicarboxylate transport system substrate-binding protein
MNQNLWRILKGSGPKIRISRKSLCNEEGKMKKLRLLTITIAFCLSFGFAGSAASAAEYNWTLAASIMDATESGQALTLMAKLIEQYTFGKVKFKNVSLAGQVCSQKTCIDQLNLKAIEIAECSDGNYGAFSKVLTANEFPYIYDSIEDAGEILKGPVLFKIRENTEKQDKRMLLTIIPSGSGRHLWSNVPVKTPSDLKEKNLKVRAVLSACENETIKAWGGVATPVPWSELYAGLQSKLVNAHLLQTDLCYRYKVYEASPYCAEIYYRVSSFLGIYMNLDYFKTLPPDIQSAVLEAARVAQQWAFENARRYENQSKRILQGLGVTFYTPTAAEMKQWKDLALSTWPKLRTMCDEEILNLVLDAQGKSFPKN